MGCLLKKDLIRWCKEQEGTEENPMGSNRTIYGEICDNAGLFPEKKNGIAWCGTYCEAGVFENVFSYDSGYDDNDRKWDTLFFLYQPAPSQNYACACRFFAQYMRDAGAWHSKDDFEEGDIVFFGDEGNEYHQGIVVGMPDDRCGFYSSEGNHNNRVETVWHDIDENISGFGVPRYDDEPDESDDHHDDDSKPEPQPQPAPEPQPEPVDDSFRDDYKGTWKINAPSGLRLRASAGDGETLCVMPYGKTVHSTGYYETIGGTVDWLNVFYDGIEGWCSRDWLTDHEED